MGPTVCSLLAVGFLACLMHLTPIRSQCTTKHCDQGDNEQSVLTAMVARLQDTMEQQQHSMDQLRQEHQHSMEQLRQEHQHSIEELRKDHQYSMDQIRIQYRELQQLLNNSVEHQEQQLGELTKLREALAKCEQSM